MAENMYVYHLWCSQIVFPFQNHQYHRYHRSKILKELDRKLVVRHDVKNSFYLPADRLGFLFNNPISVPSDYSWNLDEIKDVLYLLDSDSCDGSNDVMKNKSKSMTMMKTVLDVMGTSSDCSDKRSNELDHVQKTPATTPNAFELNMETKQDLVHFIKRLGSIASGEKSNQRLTKNQNEHMKGVVLFRNLAAEQNHCCQVRLRKRNERKNQPMTKSNLVFHSRFQKRLPRKKRKDLKEKN